MHILFIAPYPPSRIRIRSYGFLSHLSYNHKITLLVQVSSAQELADVEVLQKQGYEVIVVRESRKRSMLNSGVALLNSSPLQVAYAFSKHFLQMAYTLCEQRMFDVIHVEHLRGIASVGELARHYPLVWDAVDCISLLFQQTALSGHSVPLRMMAALEYKRTKKYEAQILHSLPYVVTIADRDRQALLNLHTASVNPIDVNSSTDVHIDVVPSGVDLEYFHPLRQERRPHNIIFFGKMSYHANVAAALYLYHKIMPLVWSQQPDVTLTLVGSKPPRALQRLANDPRVKVTGYVEDLRPYIREAQVMLSPTVYSVGLQNKVLESMALGTPTVVAFESAKSLSATHGQDLLVAKSIQEFVEYTLLLLNDSALHEKISQNGRQYVETYHDWHVITEQLIAIYQQSISTFANNHSSIVATEKNVSYPFATVSE